MVLPCAMVPQIILYESEGREKVMTVSEYYRWGRTMTINWTVREAGELR